MTLVSVIVPNLHSPVIGQTLESLRCQDVSLLREILVVGQDRYRQVEEDALVRFLVTPQPVNPAVARNIGIGAARGAVLAFVDADCIAAPDWLVRLTEPYCDPQMMVVGGSVDFVFDNYWTFSDNLATFHEYLPSTRRGLRSMLPSLNLSLRAAILANIGGFDERYPFAAGEDADFTMRLRLHGYPLYFEPRAIVTHCPQRRTAGALLTHAYRFGRYSARVDPRYQDALGVPKLLRQWWVVLLSSPLLAAEVIRWMMVTDGLGWRHMTSWPPIYVAKLAWCIGAARSLRCGGIWR